MYLEYHTVVVLCYFLVLAGNSFSCYVRVVLLCQFLVLAGNRQFFCCGRKVLLRPEKKVLVVCLAGCAVVSVFGSGDYDWKKNFYSSVWRVVLCNEFVLVLAKIDLIHFEHSTCISSTLIKINTNP